MDGNNRNEKLLPGLTMQLSNGLGGVQTINFNRFRYIGSPSIVDIDAGKAVIANRDDMIKKWFKEFKEANYKGATKINRYYTLIQFVAHVDSLQLPLNNRAAVEAWERLQVSNLRLGKFKANTGIKQLSNIKNLYKIFGYPINDWFSNYSIMQREPEVAYGYSDKELMEILRLLHAVFRQTSKQILQDPKAHLYAPRTKATGRLSHNGIVKNISAVITKCFCSAAFLLAYYTWGNLSSILRLSKLDKKTTEHGDWYTNSVEKPRANKIITLSLGDNNSMHVPKHALNFVKRLNQISSLVDKESPSLLLQACNRKITPLKATVLSTFNKWVGKIFNLNSDDKKALSITVSRMRKTGSSRYLALTDNPIETALLLGNTPAVLRKHYSQGNSNDNSRQLLATSLALQEAVKNKSIRKGKKSAAKMLKVEILPYEAFLKKYKNLGKEAGGRTAIGTGCKSPYGKEGSKYRKKVEYNIEDIESINLACADILQCFGCKNQIIIEEVDDIWCLISFRDSLYESKLDHVTESHFLNNYKKIIKRIDAVISEVDTKVQREALNKLNKEGRHPLWPDEYNMMV